MTEIQKPKQKVIAHAAQAPALRVEPVWNLEFVILNIMCQGRDLFSDPRTAGSSTGPNDQVSFNRINLGG